MGKRTVFFAAAMVASLALPVMAGVPESCAACHGQDGVAKRDGVPHLDGQKDDYMASALKDLKRRQVADHSSFSAPDADQAIAAWAAAAPSRPAGKAPSEAAVARGGEIYSGRCSDCHTEMGRNGDEGAPVLASQDLSYLKRATVEFSNGTRRSPKLMKDAYQGLTPEDLGLVAEFLHGQPPVAPPEPKKKRRR